MSITRTALAAVLAIASAGWASPSRAAQAPDAWITTKVKMALLVASIDVEVADGVARLTGTVRSQSDRLTALTLARTTDGVRSVIGDLDVKAQ